jgi:hypothetical protein
MPMPMSNEDALAYARAHRDPTIGVVTASNRLGVAVCRLVFLSLERHEPFVNQAGPTNRMRGNLDPSDEPLLKPGEQNLVSFPNDPNAPGGSMAVTAFGCERTDRHFGRYVVDEDTVVFQQTIAIRDQGQVVLAR